MIKKLVIFCIIFGLLSFSLKSLDQEHSFFWTIKMKLSVSGKYKNSDNDFIFSGKYSFDIIYKAGMERDNGDYVLYQGENKLFNVVWDEIIGKQSPDNKKHSISEKIKSRLKLNYILRENGYICFCFEISSVWAPYDGQSLKRILLPRSAENESIHFKIKYKKHITKGSNKIELKDNDIYIKDKIQKIFKWTWKKKEPTWENQHTVNLKLTIKRSNK